MEVSQLVIFLFLLFSCGFHINKLQKNYRKESPPIHHLMEREKRSDLIACCYTSNAQYKSKKTFCSFESVQLLSKLMIQPREWLY